MKIKEAVNRITWRLSNGWKANENDIKALETIFEFIDNEVNKKPDGLTNLFAKLYISYLGELHKFYRADVFSNIPQNEINRILSDDIFKVMHKYQEDLKVAEMASMAIKKGIFKHPASMTKDEKSKIEDVELIPMDEIQDNLTTMINLVINKL